jgi:hypothetical protein
MQNHRRRYSTQRTERRCSGSYGQYGIGRDRELSPRARDIVPGKLRLGTEDGDYFVAINCRYQGHHNDRNEREGHTVAPCEGRWHLTTKEIFHSAKCAIDEPSFGPEILH